MNRNEYFSLMSEKNTLINLISKTPDDFQFKLEKMSLNSRLEEVENKLKRVDKDFLHFPSKLKITFRGAPVLGTTGISSNFGTIAIKALTDAINCILKSLNVGKSENANLMITDIAKGSFGFVLEDIGNQSFSLLPEDDKSSNIAINKLQEILGFASNSDSNELIENIIELDLNSINKIKDFVEILDKNKAVCAINFNEHSFSFQNNNQVKTALSHLDIAKKSDIDEILNVMFLGVLPNKRKCEFKLVGDDNVYVASIDKKIKDPELINKHLNSYVNASFKTSQIEDRPKKYLLLELPCSW
ncbi:hypothetical protein GA0061081_102232 [Gilliamella bombicola]|uniref:Uncharacterized protein n=1 Tax=Gilliamella bombicola TaxID=1798182 RepID=A0A1C4A4G0_9GAMM|nr:hypothetical protein [Gilliamella bombicola]SCB89433.1 hypothetical protein GA0061081_102232 [Gilliamella bombicola]